MQVRTYKFKWILTRIQPFIDRGCSLFRLNHSGSLPASLLQNGGHFFSGRSALGIIENDRTNNAKLDFEFDINYVGYKGRQLMRAIWLGASIQDCYSIRIGCQILCFIQIQSGPFRQR